MERAKLLILQTECALFFEENPYAFETVKGLATRLGRPVEDLESVLENLTHLCILRKTGDGLHAYYQYIEPQILSV